MKRYPKERKKAILAKLCGLDRKSVPQVAEEEGVSVAALIRLARQGPRRGLAHARE